MSDTKVNLPRALIAAIAFVHMNSYFGWNALPHSPEELLADLLVLLMGLLSYERRECPPAHNQESVMPDCPEMNLITMNVTRLDWEMQWDWVYARWTCCDPLALALIG